MADDDSSPSSEKSGVPGWLTFLGIAGGVGVIAGLAVYSERRQKREAAELVDYIARLTAQARVNQGRSEEDLERLVTSASDQVSKKIESLIEERVERRLDAADARFNRRIDQVSDSAASAVEQILRVGTRRTDEVIREAEERLAHIGWLDEAVTPAADDSSRSGGTADDDPVWADLNDFQRKFES